MREEVCEILNRSLDGFSTSELERVAKAASDEVQRRKITPITITIPRDVAAQLSKLLGYDCSGPAAIEAYPNAPFGLGDLAKMWKDHIFRELNNQLVDKLSALK